jgi:hypothetical protein
MTLAMTALHPQLPVEDQEPLPPRQITDTAAAKAGTDIGGEQDHQIATMAAHFGYGAAAGGLYGAFAGRSGLPAPAEGMLYGLAVWGGSYLGLLPGAGLYRSATEESAPRNGLMIAAHLIWGAALGTVTCALKNRE